MTDKVLTMHCIQDENDRISFDFRPKVMELEIQLKTKWNNDPYVQLSEAQIIELYQWLYQRVNEVKTRQMLGLTEP